MKYYIPTSSLNLDNILQAESISPYLFYSKRKTGYMSIEVLPEFRGIERIILFQYPVRFTIDDPNRYNFPLLIEVEDENQLAESKLHMESEGVYSFGDTLYLTPSNCRFFFFSEQEYNLTTINTRSNKAIKFYEYYKIFPIASGFQLIEMPPFSVEDLSIQETHETLVDKRKGLLYAYLLGLSLSVSPELARQNRITQDIYDIVSGILANYSMSDKFKEKLNSLLDEYINIDKIEQENSKLFNDSLDAELGRFKFLKPSLIDLLKKWGVWDCVYRKLSKRWGCKTLLSMSELVSVDDYRGLISEVERRTNNAISNYKRPLKNTSLNIIDFKRDSISIIGLPILCIAINYIVTNNLTPEQLSAHRADICLGMINKIKDYYISENGKQAWFDGPRQYFNGLYNHIKNFGVSFDVKAIDNAEMSAIAAFLLRGHRIDNYLVYLKMNEFSDYCCPLMLWGALCGYMEMNRDVLSEVLTIDTYEIVYHNLFSNKMYKAVWEQPKNNSSEYYEKIDTVESECTDVMTLHVWQQEILNFTKEYALKKNKRKLMESLQQAFVENGNCTDYDKFLTLLLRYEGWTTTQTKKPSTAWIKIQKHFAPNFISDVGGKKNKSRNKKRDVINGPSLFEKLFYEDDDAWLLIESIVPDKDREVLHNDLIWFQSEIRKPRKERYKYYQNLDETNNEVIIDKFCHLKERPDKNGRHQAPYFTALLRQRIREILDKEYCGK